MIVQENVTLASKTSLGLGGPARFFAELRTVADVQEAVQYAQAQQVPLRILGAGTNVLVPDEGVPAFVGLMRIPGITFGETNGDTVDVRAGAGERWDDFVDVVTARGLYGVANLAGVPGSVGGAVVQNIGAYGSELKDTCVAVAAVHTVTGEAVTLEAPALQFGYRTSLFRQTNVYIITSATFRLATAGELTLSYPDVQRVIKEQGAPHTPAALAQLIREVRRAKFPATADEHTAGSFFKNPVVPAPQAQELAARFPGLPTFVQPDGSVKLSLAWLLDHVLNLRGYAQGAVRLYERQPLVLVAQTNATARAVDAFATAIATRVHAVTGVRIEREVESL